MKELIIALCILIGLNSCKDKKEEEFPVIHDTITIVDNTKLNSLPTEIVEVIEAHGGLDRWEEMNNICFQITRDYGVETHTVSLKDRRAIIQTDKWSIGNDGENVWLLENDEGIYDGNARFYNNLMFYFYAMPFVLSDPGIIYEHLDPVELEGKLFDAIAISYEDGVGDSPKDNYILYFDPDSLKMEWLAYTVTYKTNEVNTEWRIIKYEEWEEVNNLLLPKRLNWYHVVNGRPTTARKAMEFNRITITQTVLDPEIFKLPNGGQILER